MPVRFLVHVKRPSILPDKIAMCFYFCIYFFAFIFLHDGDCNGGDGNGDFISLFL